jgi:hypothetical protein
MVYIVLNIMKIKNLDQGKREISKTLFSLKSMDKGGEKVGFK